MKKKRCVLVTASHDFWQSLFESFDWKATRVRIDDFSVSGFYFLVGPAVGSQSPRALSNFFRSTPRRRYLDDSTDSTLAQRRPGEARSSTRP